MVTTKDEGAERIAQYLWLLAERPVGGLDRFRAEAELIIERQVALQHDFRALAGYADPLPATTQRMLARTYGIDSVRVPVNDHEIDRVARNLWVLAKMPAEGPQAFYEEAKRLIARRAMRDRPSAE